MGGQGTVELQALDRLYSFLSSNGRHQEEDAGNEGGEGQCHGQI